MHMNRHFLFRHYWWISIVGAISAISFIFCNIKNEPIPLIGSVVAAALAFCYFVQQQRLAEIVLFKDLFTQFNHRYDSLNDKLFEITNNQGEQKFNHRETIVDYFNLCAEEYLFYKEGYIHQDVWCSWCRGMLCYMSIEPFKSIWDEEQATGSYYGLSLELIREGAKKITRA